MKRLVLIILLIFSIHYVEASHELGGEIYFTNDSGSFTFTLVNYSDCAGISLPGAVNLNLIGYAGPTNQMVIPVTQIAQFHLNQLIPCDSLISGAASPNCFPGSSNGSGIKMTIYQSQPIQLTGVPPVGGWTVFVNNCCRGNSMNVLNSASSSYVYWARILPFTPSGASAPVGVENYVDHSAAFQAPAFYKTCLGIQISIDVSAADIDGDSIFYGWTQPLDDFSLGMNGWNPPVNPAGVQWHSSYSTTNPFPGQAILEAQAGIINYTAVATGHYYFAIEVESWRQGQLISRVMRDVPFFISNCNSFNTPPSTWLMSGTHQLDTTFYGYETTLELGDTLKGIFSSSDFDLYPLTNTPTHLEFLAFGSSVPVPLGSTNCLQPPCMKFQPVAGQTGFISPLTNSVELEWITDCSVIQDNPLMSVLVNYRVVSLGVSDLNCPNPDFSQKSLLINVRMTKADPPGLTSVSGASGAVQLSWQIPSDTGSGFGGYVIYFEPVDSSLGTWRAVDTVSNYSFSQWTLSGLPAMGLGRYTMRSISKCGFESVASDTIVFMNIGVEENELSILKIYPNPSKGDFFVHWMESGIGKAKLELMDIKGQLLSAFEIQTGRNHILLDLPAGHYIIKIISSSSINYERLVIQ